MFYPFRVVFVKTRSQQYRSSGDGRKLVNFTVDEEMEWNEKKFRRLLPGHNRNTMAEEGISCYAIRYGM